MRQTKKGFALLITLVVVSVVLAIGLSLLFVTTRQYMLSVTALESEKAFQAAQIGLDCMRLYRNYPITRDRLLAGGDVPRLSCGGKDPTSSEGSTILSSNNRFFYNYRYVYDLDGNRCLSTNMYIADFRQATEDFTMPELNFTCRAGTVCTAIFSGGFNRPCDQLDSLFTVHRELLISY